MGKFKVNIFGLGFGKLCQSSLATKLDPATWISIRMPPSYFKFKINAVMSRDPSEGQDCSTHKSCATIHVCHYSLVSRDLGMFPFDPRHLE